MPELANPTDQGAGTIPGFGKIPASNGKKAAKKAPKKAAAKKGTKKAAAKGKSKKETKPRGESIRLRGFKLLAKGDLTGAQVKEKLGLSGVPSFLKDEAVIATPRVKRFTVPNPETGADGPTHYTLTAAGKKALEKGTVDSEAAPRSVGK